MNDLREAAEHLVNRWTHEDYRGSKTSNAALMLAKHYLAEHPADDEEPVTDEWLRSVCTQDKSAATGNTCGWFALNGLDYYNGVWTVGRFRMKHLKTRGDVQRLCKALGIELKEASVPK